MANSLSYSERVAVGTADRRAYLDFACEAAKLGGAATLPFFRGDLAVDDKRSGGRFDPVTLADRGAEEKIRSVLKARYPEHGVFGEEFGFEAGNGLTWVIDPIDGTRAFMTGMLHWGVLFGLFDGAEPLVGAMYQPYVDELFAGDSHSATFVRGDESRVLSTSGCQDLATASLASTGPQWFSEPDQLAAFKRLSAAARMTRFGGDCYVFAMLAMGTVDLACEANLQAYDILPLIPIIRGAGGVVTRWDGGDPAFGGTVLASANERLHEAALARLRAD